jgi:hypothetical protein
MSELDSRFQRLITKVASSAKARAQSAISGSGRVLAEYSDTPSGRFDPVMKDEFDLSGLEQIYSSMRESGAPWGELGALTAQHSIMSAYKRDQRLRRRTRIQAQGHAASRLAGDGSESGPLLFGHIEFIKYLNEASVIE